MKIILVRPNYSSHIITPPLGLGYLSSYLQQHDISVKILDGLCENVDNTQLKRKILYEEPDAVGISCLTAYYYETIELSRKLKKENVRVIIGGVHPTFLPEETIRDSGCDFVITGESEIALLSLIKNNFHNNRIDGVYSEKNIASLENGYVKSKIINNLDNLPFPDWEQINPNRYPKAPHGAIVRHFPIAPVMTTRGCPYKCIFCASPGFYDCKIRFRSPENVLKEIKFLVEQFGVKEIHFEDDNLTIKRSHIEKICHLILQEDLKISWACPNGIRADTLDKSLIQLMKKSGCYYFAMGIESSNQQILDKIKKQEKIEVIKNTIELASEVGISCQGFFIFGLPGETKESIKQTIHFAKYSGLDRAQFLILDVLPGSELWISLQGQFISNYRKKSYKEPEWIPHGISGEFLLKSQSRAFREFYFKSPLKFFKLLFLIKPGQLKYLFRRLIDYRILHAKNLFKRSSKLEK